MHSLARSLASTPRLQSRPTYRNLEERLRKLEVEGSDDVPKEALLLWVVVFRDDDVGLLGHADVEVVGLDELDFPKAQVLLPRQLVLLVPFLRLFVLWPAEILAAKSARGCNVVAREERARWVSCLYL